MAINEKYSYKDFMHKTLTHIEASEFNDSEIVGSCFYAEKIREVFPADVHDLILTDCNLDNVILPVGCIVNGGTNKRILIQNDLEDWIVDEDDNPIEPVHKERFTRLGLSIDPQDIPQEKVEENICEEKIRQEHAKIDAQILATEAQKQQWR